MLAAPVAAELLSSHLEAQFKEPPPRVPRPATEFVVEMLDGKPILLSSMKGKVCLVEFLLTTCPHCQQTAQIVERLYKEYGPKGFQPIGVAINEMPKLVLPDFVKQFRLTFPVGFANRASIYNYLEFPGNLALTVPRIVVIDRKWQIRLQQVGGDEFFRDEEKNLRAKVEELLGAPRPAAKKAAAKS
jgi:thiol-disulfide isomerase/thioredoxin